jgi:hypothetical protein
MPPTWLVTDPDLSLLDLAIAPNGNIVVSSERPLGAADAVRSVREYDTTDGHPVRVLSRNGKAEFRKPRGLRFAPAESSTAQRATRLLASTSRVASAWVLSRDCRV